MTNRIAGPLGTILRIAETSLTVSDLAVRDLWYAEPTWPAERAASEMQKMNLDYAPVGEEPVRRYVDRSQLEGHTVADHGMPIDAWHLVSGDLSLADGLTVLAERQFFFVIERDRIVGIVGLADLQRPPVSMVTFGLILAAEAGMNRLVDQSFPDERWLPMLGDRRGRVEDVFRERRRRNAEITRLECLMLEDRLRLLSRADEIWAGLDFPSRTAFGNWGEELKRLRDPLAHGGSVLDAEPDPDRALALIGRVRSFAERIWDTVGGTDDAPQAPTSPAEAPSHDVARLLLATTLRDEYEVLLLGDGHYGVVAIDPHGTRHEDRISREVADWLRDRLRGQQVDAEGAATTLEQAVDRFRLPFTHGHKLMFYAQKVLLILVARKEAGYDKVGRRFVYSIY